MAAWSACFLLPLLSLAGAAAATVYTVGGSAGWDVSADLEQWPLDKKFLIGDVLSFTYSRYHTVNEVMTKSAYDNCTSADGLLTGKDGNTTVMLTKAGSRYFISGTQLYCLGGMRLQVDVVDPSAPAVSPLGVFASPPPTATGGSSQLWWCCLAHLGLVIWTSVVVLAHTVAFGL